MICEAEVAVAHRLARLPECRHQTDGFGTRRQLDMHATEADAACRCREQAQQQLAATINRLGTHDVVITPVVLFGYPAEAIVDAAIDYQTDLIVMATHGYSGLRRWALGSVADKVLHASPVPLLLVRAQPRRDAAAHAPDDRWPGIKSIEHSDLDAGRKRRTVAATSTNSICSRSWPRLRSTHT